MIGDDGSVVRVEEKIFKDVSDLQAQIEAGTAFHPKASADGLTAMTVVEDEAAAGVTLHEYKDPTTGESVEQGGNVTSGFNIAGATGGQYVLRVNGKETDPLDFDASASDVQAALVAIGESSASVSGDQASGFSLAGLSAKPSGDFSSLTGGDFPKEVSFT